MYEYEDYIFHCHYHDIRLDQGNDQLMGYLAIFHDHAQRFPTIQFTHINGSFI